jgi:hypothetical protein
MLACRSFTSSSSSVSLARASVKGIILAIGAGLYWVLRMPGETRVRGGRRVVRPSSRCCTPTAAIVTVDEHAEPAFTIYGGCIETTIEAAECLEEAVEETP